MHVFLSGECACQCVSEGERGNAGTAQTAECIRIFFLCTLQPRADVSDSCGKRVYTSRPVRHFQRPDIFEQHMINLQHPFKMVN